MNESEFKQYIARTILESLMRNLPGETRTVLENLEP